MIHKLEGKKNYTPHINITGSACSCSTATSMYSHHRRVRVAKETRYQWDLYGEVESGPVFLQRLKYTNKAPHPMPQRDEQCLRTADLPTVEAAASTFRANLCIWTFH